MANSLNPPVPVDHRIRRRAAVQMGYVSLLTAFVLWPNLQTAPSVLLVAATALAAVWLLGGLTAWTGVRRADEMLLCGSASPVLVGLTQLAYRADFWRTHGALTRPGVTTDSAGVFLGIWVAEILLVLLPGVLFLWWNARALAPVDDGRS